MFLNLMPCMHFLHMRRMMTILQFMTVVAVYILHHIVVSCMISTNCNLAILCNMVETSAHPSWELAPLSSNAS